MTSGTDMRTDEFDAGESSRPSTREPWTSVLWRTCPPC